jgi:hypothetical protein
LRTLHKRWLLSFTSLPAGKEVSEGAGHGSQFFRSLLDKLLVEKEMESLGASSFDPNNSLVRLVYTLLP